MEDRIQEGDSMMFEHLTDMGEQIRLLPVKDVRDRLDQLILYLDDHDMLKISLPSMEELVLKRFKECYEK